MAGQGGKTKDSSLGSVYEICKVLVEVNEVCKGLVDQSQDVSTFITENREHVSENEELASMVPLYFENTTKTLNLFKMNKCTDEFETQYESVYKEHVMLLVKIRELEVVLKKKQKRAKIGRRVTIGVIGAVFIPVVALTVLAASSNPTYSSGAGANAGEKAIEYSKKLAGLLKKYENSKEAQIDMCLLIENRTEANIEAMRMIKDKKIKYFIL